MKNQLSPAGRIWIVGAVTLSLLFLAATVLRQLTPEPRVQAMLHPMNLGVENNVAAWWSGMLLLIAGLHAFDGSRRQHGSQPTLVFAWLVISAVLFFFSLDEVGSVHERVGLLANDLGFSEWLPLGALAALLGSASLYALYQMWNVPPERKTASLLFCGFVFLASVAPQEFIEHRVHFSTAEARAARLGIEEGSELIGILLIMRATMTNTIGLSGNTIHRETAATFEALRPSLPMYLILVAASVALAFITASLGDQHRGHPADWLAASAFIAGGLVILRPVLCDKSNYGGLMTLLSLGLFCLGSMAAVAIGPATLVRVGPLWANERLIVLIGIVMALGLTTFVEKRQVSRLLAIMTVAGITALVAFGLPLRLLATYLLTQLIAVVAFAVAASEVGVLPAED